MSECGLLPFVVALLWAWRLFFFTSTHMSTLVFTEVTIPQLSAALQSKYEYGLKSVVDVAAQDIADRLKGVTDPKEQYALIEKYTDYQRFFPR